VNVTSTPQTVELTNRQKLIAVASRGNPMVAARLELMDATETYIQERAKSLAKVGRRKGIAVAAASGLAVGTLAAWGANLATGAVVLGVIGAVSNAVMAVAAGAAFFLWRKQAITTSRIGKEHEVALRVMTLAARIEQETKRSLDDVALLWLVVEAGGAGDLEVWRQHLDSKIRPLEILLHEEWSGLLADIHANWSREDAALLEPLRALAHDWSKKARLLALRRTTSGELKTEPSPYGWDWLALFQGDSEAQTAFIGRLETSVNAIDRWARERTGK
jgi:hypothetical protein